MEAYQTEEYRGYTINIYQDIDTESPRIERENLGTIYSIHRDYNPDGHKIGEILNDEEDDFSDDFKKNYLWSNIYYYEHGGITIRTYKHVNYAHPFDSGCFGVIAISKADAIKEWGKKYCTKEVREKALRCLEGEVEDLDNYYTGNIYGYVTENEDGEEFDSCWGFYGYDALENIFVEQRGIIDKDIAEREANCVKMRDEVKDNLASLIGVTCRNNSEIFRIHTDMFGQPIVQKAEEINGVLYDYFYHDIALSDIPESVLKNFTTLLV